MEFLGIALITPLVVYIQTLQGLHRVSEAYYVIYILLFPFIILPLSYLIKWKLHLGIKRALLIPIVVFLILQIIPLPRTPFYGLGVFIDSPLESGEFITYEPFAIGIGYPFSIIKVFLGNGCLSVYAAECTDEIKSHSYLKLVSSVNDPIHVVKGDVVLLPDGIFNAGIGMLLYAEVIFLLILLIEKMVDKAINKKIIPPVPPAATVPPLATPPPQNDQPIQL